MLTEIRLEQSILDSAITPEDAYKAIMDYLVVNPYNISPIDSKDFDLVIVTGSSRIEVPIHAALHLGDAPLVICSGKRGLKTKDWPNTEGVTFKDIFKDFRSGTGVVEAEEEAENGDKNYLHSIRKGVEIVGRPLKNVGIYCLQPIQRRFDFFHHVYGGCDRVILFSPPLPNHNKFYGDKNITEFTWKLRLATGEVNRLDWMKSKYPQELSNEEIPFELFLHKRFLEDQGFVARPVHTPHLFK